MPYSNSFASERMSSKVKWFLKLSPTERHNIAVGMLRFVERKNIKRKHDKRLFKALQVIKQK